MSKSDQQAQQPPQHAPASSAADTAGSPSDEPQPSLSAPADAGGGFGDPDKPGCPICEFIEAGPCGSQHKVWVACRGEAKEQEVDYVQHCGDRFRAFFGCMLSHQGYYQPLLEAFHVDTDLSQQAIDNNGRREDARGESGGQPGGQPGQQQQQAGPPPPSSS